MNGSPASLWPSRGEAREVFGLIRDWVRDGGPPIEVQTSGSTGDPKMIRLSHAAVLASARASIDRLGGPGQWLMALPTSGVGGLQVLVRSALVEREPVFLDEHHDLSAAIDALGPGRRYVSFVPTQFFRLVEQDRHRELSVFDAVLLGGAATSPHLLARAAEAGVAIVRTYGMTETAGGCVYDGVPLAGVEVRIGADGRIALAGPMLGEGTGDWWRTEDLGRFSPQGRLEVLGRADQTAVSGGVNVPLALVEHVLAAVPTVEQVAVVARADEEWGHLVVACVRGGLDRDSAAAALEAAGYPRTWTPRLIERVSEFPLLPGGKIDRRALGSADTS